MKKVKTAHGLSLFRESVRLVWASSPGWATVNIVLSVLRSLLPLALVILIKVLIDDITGVVSSGYEVPVSDLIWKIVAVVGVYFLDEATSDLSGFVWKKQALSLEIYMYGLLHSKAIKLDLINFEQAGYYDILSRAAREAPWRPNSIVNNLISMLRGLLSLILMAGLLLSLHWAIAVALIVVNIPGIWLRLHYADILYNFQRDQTPEARKSGYFNWLLTGDRPSRELRLFGLGDYFISLFRKSFLAQKEEEVNIIRKRTMIELVSDLVKAAVIFLIIFYIARQTIGNKLTLGQMAMFLLAFRQGMIYIKELFGSASALYEDSLFIADAFEFLHLKESLKAVPPVIIPPPLVDRIVVENLVFSYPVSNSPAINNVSFEIRKGEIVALAGPNGAGKSTLVKLLARLYDPDSGTISYDGADIRNIDPELYRKHFSVVFQDFMLYNMQAGDNIRMGNLDEKDPDRRIKESAMITGVHDLISNLPKGYDTVIGKLFDDSRELSWGEWQRIALARALFRDAPVLILDEPSSALDAQTEYDIFSRFREIVKGRTALLISHRFASVSLADRIIVLDSGSVAESGTHDELINKKGMYWDMYTKQAGRYKGEGV